MAGLNLDNQTKIAYKLLSGKAQTQETFADNEEPITTNVTLGSNTIYADTIDSNPTGLTSLYDTDGVVERVRFSLEIIPDTQIGVNQSQGYRLKLPSDYTANGALGSTYSSNYNLSDALGRLQIVDPKFGLLEDGSTPYDGILYEGDGSTEIPKFSPINWRLDRYSGILFVQDPPAGYDISVERPSFFEGFLYVGQYLNDINFSGDFVSTSQFNTYTGDTRTELDDINSDITFISGVTDTKINLSEKGVINGVATLGADGLVPSSQLPPQLQNFYVTADIAERDGRFVASGDTPGVGQIESIEGLTVLVLDASGDTGFTGITGSQFYVDTTGLLDWSPVSFQQDLIIDFVNIQNRPNLISNIIDGNGISSSSVTNSSGLTDTTVNVDYDDQYIGLDLSSQVTIKGGSIDSTRMQLVGGTGTTDQVLAAAGGGSFKFITLPLAPVQTVTAQSGVTNIGTASNPIIVGQIIPVESGLEITPAGFKVADQGINTDMLRTGDTAGGLTAYGIPISTGSSYQEESEVGSAIEDLYARTLLNAGNIADNGSDIADLQTGFTDVDNRLTTLEGTAITSIVASSGTGESLIVDGSGNTAILKKLVGSGSTTVTSSGDTIVINSTGGGSSTIGDARPPSTYDDGAIQGWADTTPTGYALTDVNLLFKALLPATPDDLDNLSGGGTFVNGNLSFGPTKNDTTYVNVGTTAGNPVVDINELYTSSANRLGITRTAVSGTLNDNKLEGPNGIYLEKSFANADQGSLVLEVNNTVIETIDLTLSTGATSGLYLSLSQLFTVLGPSGQPFIVPNVSIDGLAYRTGTYNLPTLQMQNGWNYLRILHTGSTFNNETNYLEWVYDADTNTISILSNSLNNLNLTGSKYISGVEYHTAGNVDYTTTVNNAYRYIYSDDLDAISFPTRVNLGDISSITITGSGINNVIGGVDKTLPTLDTAATNPQDTNINVVATLPINSLTVLGNVGNLGKIQSGIAIKHPFTFKSFSGGVLSLTGFLLNNTIQPNNDNSEFFTGEVNRLQARDYTALAYGAIDGGTYDWDSTQDLISGDVNHNTGMLVFNGELMYPNTSYLTTQYGITTGDFSSVTNGPTGNTDYSLASGQRDYYRKFKSNNGTTQSTLTFSIEHGGLLTDFLTNGGIGGTPTGNQIKFEFMIKRSGGQTHGWANPFASTGNPEGIANTSTSHSGGLTTVTCTLSTTPRVASGDLVIVRMKFADGYSNRVGGVLSVDNI